MDTFVSSDRTGCSHLCFGRDGRNSISQSTCTRQEFDKSPFAFVQNADAFNAYHEVAGNCAPCRKKMLLEQL